MDKSREQTTVIIAGVMIVIMLLSCLVALFFIFFGVPISVSAPVSTLPSHTPTNTVTAPTATPEVAISSPTATILPTPLATAVPLTALMLDDTLVLYSVIQNDNWRIVALSVPRMFRRLAVQSLLSCVRRHK